MGELELSGATLKYIPNENFSAHAEPIHEMLHDDEFKDKVVNLCRLLLDIKSNVKISDRIISMKYNTFIGFINSPLKDFIILALKDGINGQAFIRIIDDNSIEDIKI